MILVIDNYDSFTYNLVQHMGEMGCEVQVFRNDGISLEEVLKLAPTHLVISPGPGTPQQAKLSNRLILALTGKLPILGVCLGHQCLAYAYGGEVGQAERIMHGRTSAIYHNGRDLFTGLPNPFYGTRYHSLLVREENLPDCLEVTAHTTDGEVMGLKLKDHPVYGVQFHPESILTKEGKQLMQNFLNST